MRPSEGLQHERGGARRGSGGRGAARPLAGRAEAAGRGREARDALRDGRRFERDLRGPARRGAHGAAPPAPARAEGAQRDDAARSACARRAEGQRRAARASARRVRRPRRARRVLLRDGLGRGLDPPGPSAGAVLLRLGIQKRPWRRAGRRHRQSLARGLARRRARRLRQARRLPRAPGGSLARPPRDVPFPRAARARRRRRLAARPHAALLPPRHHPRRLPVRERDVPARRAREDGGGRATGRCPPSAIRCSISAGC